MSSSFWSINMAVASLGQEVGWRIVFSSCDTLSKPDILVFYLMRTWNWVFVCFVGADCWAVSVHGRQMLSPLPYSQLRYSFHCVKLPRQALNFDPPASQLLRYLQLQGSATVPVVWLLFCCCDNTITSARRFMEALSLGLMVSKIGLLSRNMVQGHYRRAHIWGSGREGAAYLGMVWTLEISKPTPGYTPTTRHFS